MTDDVLVVDIRHEAGDARAELHVAGELDSGTRAILEDAIERVLANGASAVHLDLTEVAFIDSTGITVLLAAHARLEAAGELVIGAASDAVHRVLQVTGLHGVLGMVRADTVDPGVSGERDQG